MTTQGSEITCNFYVSNKNENTRDNWRVYYFMYVQLPTN